jgi:hypothetical protein
MPRESLTNRVRCAFVTFLAVAELFLAATGVQTHSAYLLVTAVLVHLWKREVQHTKDDA